MRWMGSLLGRLECEIAIIRSQRKGRRKGQRGHVDHLSSREFVLALTEEEGGEERNFF